MQNLIIWQKWMDPFGSDDEEILDQLEPEFYDEENNAIKTEGKAEEDDEDRNSKKASSIRVMATPMGIIPITENTSSSKIELFAVQSEVMKSFP